MTVKDVLASLQSPFSVDEWLVERNSRESYKNPLLTYSYTHVYPKSHPCELFGFPVEKLYAYVDNGKLIAYYLAVQSDEEIIKFIDSDLETRPAVLSMGVNEGEDDPFKWYWDYKGYEVAFHKIAASADPTSKFFRSFNIVILSTYTLEDYTLKW